MSVLYVTHPACARHDMGPGHPEQPRRVAAIQDRLVAEGLMGFLDAREAPRATAAQLERVHDPGLLDRLRVLEPRAGHVAVDEDTAMGPGTLEAALRAAGAAICAVDAVLAGSHRRAFCNVRPPGHHAERATPMGFCFFDNVAVGAAHALEAHGLERVAIVDFDVHFGNGTADIFADEPRVLYCSTYQSPLYPGMDPPTRPGHEVNCPLPAGAGGAEFRDAVTAEWLPALAEFRPEFVLVSAGFDGHVADPLAGLALTEADYAWVTGELCALADRYAQGRLVSTLEGGYALDALAASAAAHVERLIAA